MGLCIDLRRIGGQSARVERGQRALAQLRVMQRGLLRRAVELPDAEPRGAGRAGNGRDQHDRRAHAG